MPQWGGIGESKGVGLISFPDLVDPASAPALLLDTCQREAGLTGDVSVFPCVSGVEWGVGRGSHHSLLLPTSARGPLGTEACTPILQPQSSVSQSLLSPSLVIEQPSPRFVPTWPPRCNQVLQVIIPLSARWHWWAKEDLKFYPIFCNKALRASTQFC